MVLDDAGMSIVARRGRVVTEPRPRLLRYDRPSLVAAAAGTIGSPISSPGIVGPDDPRHELARLALDVVVRTSEPRSVPRAWTTGSFCREVDRTRAQLAPLRSRSALAASFVREASVAVSRSSQPDGRGATTTPGPVRVAYAVRWLELGDDRRRPEWISIVNGALSDFVDTAGFEAPDLLAAEVVPRPGAS